MDFKILTLFPDMIMSGLSESITGRAMGSGLINIDAVDIRTFSKDKHSRVDDYTYGGGAGMLMQAQSVYDAYKAVAGDVKKRCVYVTPQGKPFTQNMAHDFALEDELIILCGHYEGIDERVLEEIVTDYVSIGDYVLTGGELAAMVIVDAVSRLVPGVLGNSESAVGESFNGHLLEYPQYSRPEVWHEKRVPDELLCGDPKRINAWRLEKSIERTRERRPDLYEKYKKDNAAIERMLTKKRLLIPMVELIRRGLGEVVENDDTVTVNCETLKKIYTWVDGEETVVVQGANELATEKQFKSFIYTQKNQLPAPRISVAEAKTEDLDFILDCFEGSYKKEYILRLIAHGRVYASGNTAAFEAFDGSIRVSNGADRNGLVAYLTNRQLQKGYVPYLLVETTNNYQEDFDSIGYYSGCGIKMMQ